MTVEPTGPPGDTTPVFRWDGRYWGFVQGHRLHDRYGRQVGWLDAASVPTDVYDLSGRFMGELRDAHYVIRDAFRADPVHRASRPPAHRRTVPDPVPDRAPRDPREGWRDALPWPLSAPPQPPL